MTTEVTMDGRKWRPVCEAWKLDKDAVSQLADELWRREPDASRGGLIHGVGGHCVRTKVTCAAGGKSPISGEEYGSNSFLILWEEVPQEPSVGELAERVLLIGGVLGQRVLEKLNAVPGLSEVMLAELLSVRPSEVRKVVYDLYEANILTYEKKRDPETGWLSFYWRVREDARPVVAGVTKHEPDAGDETITLALNRTVVSHIIHGIRENHEVNWPEQDELYRAAKVVFDASVRREDDPCPFCHEPVQEDSFASSYGSPDYTTWTIDLVCRKCSIQKRVHESTTRHERGEEA